jgi:very-short-patch-repair endonuclease
VYLVGAVPSEHTYAQAALLALRGKGALSHFSAAGIWRLRAYPSLADPWVTANLAGGLARPKIHVRRAKLEPSEVRHYRGLPVTSPPRTVLDCAGVYDDASEFEALVAEARFRGLADEEEMLRQAERNPRKRGVPLLRAVLDLPGGPRHTRSKGERALLRLLREEGISGYETNSKAFGPELDFVWPAERFAVEVDGWDGHSGRIAFDRDRLKIAELQAKGVETMPVTGRQIEQDP